MKRISVWPPWGRAFVPRLGDWLVRFGQEDTLEALLARPAALGSALRKTSELLGLEVECLELSIPWILGAPSSTEPKPPSEMVRSGPVSRVREALLTLPRGPQAPNTVVALPCPAALAAAAGGASEDWARATLQAIVRSLGELDLLAGVLLTADEAYDALYRMLDHYQLTSILLRRPGDVRPARLGTLAALAVELDAEPDALLGETKLVTTERPIPWDTEPETLIRASRAWGGERV